MKHEIFDAAQSFRRNLKMTQAARGVSNEELEKGFYRVLGFGTLFLGVLGGVLGVLLYARNQRAILESPPIQRRKRKPSRAA